MRKKQLHDLSAEETKHLAQCWYERQINRISKAHSACWPLHKEWIDAYLKEELKQRLLAIGWRSKK